MYDRHTLGVECLCDAHGKHRLLDGFACGLIITSWEEQLALDTLLAGQKEY